MNLLALVWFLTSAVVIVTSPFLREVWLKSRVAWATACITGGLLTLVLCYFFSLGDMGPPGIAFICLFTSVPLNFLGLLVARAGAPRSGTFAGDEDRERP